MRNRLARWLCNLILNTLATRWYRDALDKAMRTYLSVADLHKAIELVLLNHVDLIDKPAGEQDPDLAELADIYERLTGFDAVKEASRAE